MSQPEELQLAIPGLTLAARAWGPPNAPPVLALHGWLDNSASFEPLAPLLPGIRLVALELPGHGWSQHRSADAAYHFIDWVPSVIFAADSLGWQRFSIMGHSMGAAIAALTAGAFADRVERIVMLDGLGPFTAEAAELPDRLASHVRECERLPAKEPVPHRDVELLASRLCKVVPGMTLPCARLLVARGSMPVEGGVRWRYDQRLRGTSSMRLTEAQVLAFFGRVRCPALLVRATEGYPVDVAQMQSRATALQGLREVVVPGGHHVHMQDATGVAAIVAPFLAAAT